jgi:RNA polymerase sigma-70 factor (ECF subfamily)
MDEKNLIARFKQGSEHDFGLIYDRYWPTVCRFASLYLRQTSEVEDVVQEVFIRLWEARLSLRDDTDLKRFLFIVTRNLVFTRQRRSFDKSFYSITVLNALSTDEETSHRVERNDLEERIVSLVERMPKGRRKVFEMSRLKYMTYREISSELGVSEKTVERHINEALKYLKAHLVTVIPTVLFFFKDFFNSIWG